MFRGNDYLSQSYFHVLPLEQIHIKLGFQFVNRRYLSRRTNEEHGWITHLLEACWRAMVVLRMYVFDKVLLVRRANNLLIRYSSVLTD